MFEVTKCPICGKEPKVIRDWAYESNGYGAWCTIQCKPFMRNPHLKIEEGKSTWDRALQFGVECWNQLANEIKKNKEHA